MAITEISVSKIYVLATEPTNKIKDRFWFDTTNNLLKRYDGTSWKPISVSSDDVVVLSNGNKISLTSYLNTQIAALVEGIDSKQDKLKYFQESTTYGRVGYPTENNPNIMVYSTPARGISLTLPGQDTDVALKSKNISMSVLSGTTDEGVQKFNKAVLTSTGFTITGDVIIDGNVSGSAISTSLPTSIDTASDSKLLSEKATVSALSGKQDKLTYYSEDTNNKVHIGDYSNIPESVEVMSMGNVSIYSDTGVISIQATRGINVNGNLNIKSGDLYIDDKDPFNSYQTKLNYYTEVDHIEYGAYAKIAANLIELDGNITGTGILTSISSTPSDNKLLTEKAISTSLSSKQDKLTTYKEMESSASAYDKQVRIDVDGGIHINGGEVGTVFENQFQVKATAGQMDLTGDWFYINADEFCLSANSLSGSTTIVSAISSTARDNKIPTEKAVADAIANKQDKLSYYKESNGNATVSVLNGKSIKLQAESGSAVYTTTTLSIADRSISIDATNDRIASNTNLLNIEVDGRANTTTLSGSLITNSITDSKLQLPTSQAVKIELDKKQDDLIFYEELSDKAYISNSNGGLTVRNGKGGIALVNNQFTNSQAAIVLEANGWIDGDSNLFSIDGENISVDDALLIPDIKNKQDSTDNSLNTTNKTIVGAINELLSSINTNVITSTEQKRITTTSTSAGVQMSTTAKTCMVSINPVKTNVGAIYISTSSDTAPTINPLYPDQMPKYKFPDASQVYIWSDVNGDSVDLTIEYYG